MTDAQMITLAVAILAIFGATLFNNSRITDLRDSVNRRLDDQRDAINQHIDDKFGLLSQQIKTMEDNIMRVLGDHETRLQKLEQK
jgi:hypothetical protein